MRAFTDNEGQRWEAALLDASYGSVLLILSKLQGRDIRQYALTCANQQEAMHYLDGLEDAQLRELLAVAEPWDPTGGVI